MKKHPILFLIVGIIILIVPTIIYLCFLIPKMQEEYVALMSSGGIITCGGMYGANAIPEKIKYSGLYKLSARSFTLLIVTVLVQEFIMKIIFLIATFILSYIIYRIFKEAWKNARRRKENAELAKEISRSIVKDIE